MSKLKSKLKIFLALSLSVFLISNHALAVSLSYPKPREIMSMAEKRYGIDQNALRRAQQKEAAPVAELYFSNTSPEEGEEVTASAYGLKFKNSSENYYYTWYITHVDEEGNFIDSSGNKIDEDEAIEKGKTEAMGMVARGNFDPVLFGVKYDNDNSDSDNDGFYAPFGGGDGVGGRKGDIDEIEGIGTYDTDRDNLADVERGISKGKNITRCYRHNFGNIIGGANDSNSGKDLIVECKHKFATPPFGETFGKKLEGEKSVVDYYCDSKREIGGDDGTFTEEDERCWRLNPESADTDGDGFVDEADLAGLGQNTFTWRYQKGDQVGVIIEGVSLKAINEGESTPTADEIAAKIGFNNNSSFIGGGYLDKDALKAKLLELYDGEPSPEFSIFISGIDSVGITRTMGEINKGELRTAIDEGRDLADLYEEFNDPELVFVEDNYIMVTGKIDTEGVIKAIMNSFFRISPDELEGLIVAAGTDVATIVNNYISTGDLIAQIVYAYNAGSLTQVKLDELMGILPDHSEFAGAVSVSDVIGSLDGSKLEEATAMEALQQIFIDNTIATDDSIEEDIEELVNSKSSSNAYYKIMWAGIDTCSDKSRGDMKNDECENNPRDYYDNDFRDYDYYADTEEGFTYLATKPVFEKNEENLETFLGFFPEDPVFNKRSPEFSSNIMIFSNLKNKNINSNFIYYDWEIYKCASMNDQTCTETGVWLTENCGEGDPIESCAKLNGKKIFSSESFSGGMAIDSISFSPNILKEGEENVSVLMGDEEKVYLKVALKTSELKSRKVKAVSTVMIEILQKDLDIDFYKTFKDEDDYYDYDEKICTDESSSILCPVYPYQILAAKANVDGKILGYFWEIDGRRVYAPQNCGSGCDQILTGDAASLVYLPIMKSSDNIQMITLNIQVEDDDGIVKNLTTSRAISVKNPLAIIRSDDTGLAWSRIESPDEYVNAFYTNPGNRVEFRADIVPYYLENEDTELTWFIGGQEINEDFLDKNPDLDITILDNKISFVTPIDLKGMTLGAKVIKPVTASQKKDFSDAWGVDIIKDFLEEYSSISIKPDLSELNNGDGTASMRIFMASTIKNAPEYLIFSLKLSIIIVLVWSALFGSSFFLEAYEKYERN